MEVEDKIHVFKDVYYNVPESTLTRPIETLFKTLPKAQQYWRRQDDFVFNQSYPNIFFDYNPHLPEKKRCRLNASITFYSNDKLISLSTEDTQSLIKLVAREVHRMTYGIFIMNNGIKIYFPGAYYGIMQWCKFLGNKSNGGFGEHRRYQREYACQRQKCIDDPKINGYYLQKIKKCGISAELACIYAIESITSKQFIAAIMSKTHDTAKSANFKYYTYALKNLPFILQPSIENSRWASAVQKVEIRINDKELSLENTVVAVSTTEDGLDGLPPLKRVNLDEIPKMAEAEAILTKTKEQLKLQSEKQGIIEMTSYPPEDDTKSFKFCKNLHTKDCFDLDEEGYPKNGIMPLYIGLAESTKGTHDVFGEPDKLKAVFLEKAERAKLDTPAKLQARKRQYHFNVKESWESGGGDSTYNNIALAEASAVLEEMYKQGELNYVEGNLEWTAGIYSPVRFVPLTFDEIMNGAIGKWKFYCTMDYLKTNTNLCFNMPRKKKKEGKTIVELLQPPDDVIHCAGTDPVDYAYASELGKVQSKISSVVKDLSGNLISVYHFRSEDPDESLEDLMMEMIFLGTYSLVEGNRKVAVTFLEKSLMYCFILIRHPKGEILPYKQTVPIKHVNSSKDVISKYITLVIKRIKHNLSQLKSLPIIEQHKEFDAQDTQPYDLSVADGLCEIAIESMQNYIMMKKITTDKYKYLGVAIDYAF